jgi:hypothetical protein
MWAWKRIDQILKKADRTGSRQQVVDEIVRLGEAYSIVTEYTSFLVLENDAEYQRWKIDRHNMRRFRRDRQAQTKRQDELALIRNKAMADIGPQPMIAKRTHPQTQASVPQKTGTPTAPKPRVQTKPRSQSRDFNLNFGTGPVGPLFVGVAYWLTRRKRRK